MSPSDDPSEPRPTAEMLATDALLDRVGAREPTSDDLDDPLIAALALMAGEIDLDAPPVEDTRAALARAVPELPLRPAPSVSKGLAHAAPGTGAVIDLRDVAAGRATDRNENRHPQRRPRQPEPVGRPVAMAPPRSLPRMPTAGHPGGTRAPRERRERRMRPMMVVAVAVAAIVLGSTVSAALTGGRSVNPLDGIQQVVADLKGGRTADQQKAFDEVNRHLDAAQKAATAHEYEAAEAELRKVGGSLLQRLTDGDQATAKERIAELNRSIPH